MAWNSSYTPVGVFLEVKVRASGEILKVFRKDYIPKGKPTMQLIDKDGEIYEFEQREILWRYA